MRLRYAFTTKPTNTSLTGVALVLAAILPLYGTGCIATYVLQDNMVFPRNKAAAPRPDVPVGVEVMTIDAGDGQTIPAWFIPAPSATPQNPQPTVIYFHGNAEIIDTLKRPQAIWRPLGVSLLLPEYRGYGRAKAAGVPSEAALTADGVKFYDELARRPDVDASRIAIDGYSIGGGVAAQVAARRKPAALVLEATFTSVASYAWKYGLPPCMARHPFYTDKVLPTLGVPIFISHGRADTIVPVKHGRRLHELARGSTYVELDCGHLDMPDGSGDRDTAYREEIRSFLVKHDVIRP